jgi:hypothetical protein
MEVFNDALRRVLGIGQNDSSFFKKLFFQFQLHCQLYKKLRSTYFFRYRGENVLPFYIAGGHFSFLPCPSGQGFKRRFIG